MSVAFPEIRVGDPIRHEGLAVFPLFAEASHAVDYDLSDAAINRGSVTVEEVSEAGSVPDLAVENSGDLRVLFLEGERTGRSEAEPNLEHQRADRRAHEIEDPRELRRSRSLGVLGAAVAVGGKVVAIDLFDITLAEQFIDLAS